MAQNQSKEDRSVQRNSSMNRGPMGGGPMGAPMSKASDFRGTMSKLIEYLSQYRLTFVVVFIVAIASTIFSIVGPKILGNATTLVFEGVIEQIQGTGAGIDFESIGNIILLLVVLYIISGIFAYIQGYISYA